MMTDIQETLELLDLEEIERNLFRGRSPRSDWQRVFGGQVIAQALIAAGRTVEDRACHSLHSYFLRPGDPSVPIVYDVDRIRDGRSFTTRRVRAIQHGQPIFSMGASFQVVEDGVEHQLPMPDVPDPEEMPTMRQRLEAERTAAPRGFESYLEGDRAFEERTVDPINPFRPHVAPPAQHTWMKTSGALPDDPALHQCVFAYLSDYTIAETCCRPHGMTWVQRETQMASIDHSIWFHRPFRADNWLLFAQDSPATFGSRGANRASVYTKDGTLVASVFQEALLRRRDGRKRTGAV